MGVSETQLKNGTIDLDGLKKFVTVLIIKALTKTIMKLNNQKMVMMKTF